MTNAATTERTPATPDEVWATLDRVAKYHEESVKWRKDWEERQAEADRRQAEADRQQAEANKLREKEYEKWKEEHERWRERFERETAETRALWAEAAAVVKSNGELIGGLNNSFGELAEHLVVPGILERFDELGYRFDDIKAQNFTVPGEKPGKLAAEIDILLENERVVIAVEVKARPRLNDKKPEKDHIAQHVRRLETLKEYRESMGYVSKPILGAIAGAIFDQAARDAAHKAGLFVMVQSGDTMRMEIPKGFKPREW